MMIFNQKELRQMVSNLLGDIGRELELKRVVNGDYDPSTGDFTQTSQLYTFTGGVFNYPLRNSGDISDFKSLIEINDRKVYLVPREDGVIPTIADWFIKIDNAWWAIVSIKNVNPSGYALLHELQCRKK